jgi:hypothetical protein
MREARAERGGRNAREHSMIVANGFSGSPAAYFIDVIRATSLPANPSCTRGSATTAMKPANRMQAIGFMSRQECRSRASTVNEKRSRRRLALGAAFAGGAAKVFWVESDKALVAGTDKSCFTDLEETGIDKPVLVIIAFLSCIWTANVQGRPGWMQHSNSFTCRCSVCRVMRQAEGSMQTRPAPA